MARDYGGTHGSQPWHGAQPPYGQPPYRQPPHDQPPHDQPPRAGQPSPSGSPYGQMPYGPPNGQPPPGQGARARRRRRRSITWTLLAVGGIAVAFAVFGLLNQGGPRKFTATQQKQITDWEYGKRWRDLPAGAIFPTSVSYPAPESLDDDPSLTLTAHLVGIAKQASCVSAADPTAAAVLDRDGCSAMLRATYVDETDSFVVTVGAAVLPSSANAGTAAHAINAGNSSGLGSTVRAVSFKGTPAGQFTDNQRQLSGVVARGTYVVLYTVGYADGRQRQQVSQDSYTDGEMTSAGAGVADDVLSTLAAPVPPPDCSRAGTPGC